MPSSSSSRPVSRITGNPLEWARSLLYVSNPWLSGSDRSSRTTSTPPSRSCWIPLESRSAHSRHGDIPLASANNSRIMRVSPGLSSIRSILMWLSMDPSIGKFGDRHPEFGKNTHGSAQLVEIRRLGDIAVGMQTVSPFDIGGGRRRSLDHYRNACQSGILFDLLEDVKATFLRHSQVKENDVRPGRFVISALPPQEPHGLRSIDGHAQPGSRE